MEVTLDPYAALFAGASVLVSIGAILIAWRANRLVGVYRSAAWTVSAEYASWQGQMVLTITNVGESPAKNVHLSAAADPLHVVIEDRREPFIQRNASTSFAARIPGDGSAEGVSPEDAAWGAWRQQFGRNAARVATVTWIDLEGRSRAQNVLLPTERPS